MIRLLAQCAHIIETISEWTGRIVAWLTLVLVLLISYDVAMRYLFQSGSVALQELEWHLFSLIFLLGAAYTLKYNEHVRVDVFYKSERFTQRGRAFIDLFGHLFFLIPFSIIIIDSSLPFVVNAFSLSEGSSDPGGLPYRYLLKAAIPAGFLLLVLQGIAGVIRCAQTILCPHADMKEQGPHR